MTTAAEIFATAFIYWAEILHPGSEDWTHIHCPDWETTDSYADARIYANRVRDDHPGAQVRIIEQAEGLPDHIIPVT